jgi:HSP20 family molecular chaperone IbpA
MKKIVVFFIFTLSINAFTQTKSADRRSEVDRQIEEIMKARAEMIKSLMDDSAGMQFNMDDNFDALIKKFQQDTFSSGNGLDMGAVIGEYDWRETDKEQILVLKVKQIKDKPLDIKIEKGQIKLKGDVESQSASPDQKSKRISKVHFERSFSIPDGVDQTNPTFENIDGELLIKFKKVNPVKAKTEKPKRTEMEKREPVGADSEDAII